MSCTWMGLSIALPEPREAILQNLKLEVCGDVERVKVCQDAGEAKSSMKRKAGDSMDPTSAEPGRNSSLHSSYADQERP